MPDLAPFSLRAATPADDAFLAALYRGTRADLAQLGEGATALIAMQQHIHAAGQRSAFPYACRWVLDHAGSSVAAILLDRDGTRLRVVDIATLPEARRQGAASALLRWAQQQAASAGLPLTLQVRRDLPCARGLYLRSGFVGTGGDAVFEHMDWRPIPNI